MNKEEYPIEKQCPSCKKKDTLFLSFGEIQCKNTECSFTTHYCCPLCDQELQKDKTVCPNCKKATPLKKLAYIINNSLYINHKKRCELCNNPTIHRININLSARCFHFPQCSGQGELFANGIREYTFLDFETTGLEVGRDSIIEIGAIKIDKEGYEHTFQSFVTPTKKIDDRIIKITGITNEMISDAPNLKTSLKKLITFIGTSTIVAHNADFDIPWLLTSSKRLNYDIPNNAIICTLKWAKKCGEAHKSLEALTKKYKISHTNAHRALADATATKELFFVFENIYKNQKQEDFLQSYDTLTDKILNKYKNYVQT